MTSNQKPDAADFMEKWLAHNIVAHPTPQDLAAALAALTHNCLDEAARAGISAAEIEVQTGWLAADHIQKAIDKELTVARRAGRRSPETKAGKAGPAPSPATVIVRQPPPPPYRLPARHS